MTPSLQNCCSLWASHTRRLHCCLHCFAKGVCQVDLHISYMHMGDWERILCSDLHEYSHHEDLNISTCLCQQGSLDLFCWIFTVFASRRPPSRFQGSFVLTGTKISQAGLLEEHASPRRCTFSLAHSIGILTAKIFPNITRVPLWNLCTSQLGRLCIWDEKCCHLNSLLKGA